MATDVITCPYCNAFVNNGAGRLVCPRCGERIPASAAEAIQTQPSPAPSPPSNPPVDDPDVPMPRRFSNRSIVLTILTVMVTMGLVGFKLAWETVDMRRANDLGLSKPQLFGIPPLIKVFAGLWMVGLVMLLTGVWRERKPGEAPATPRARFIFGLGICLAVLSTMAILFSGPIRRRNSQMPPEFDPSAVRSVEAANLEGLRYLPADTNLVIGVHVAELLEEPKNREFLDGLKLASLHFTPQRLESWTGLKREEIDYIVVGLRVEDELMPRTAVIVRSLVPLDSERLREKLKGTPSPDGGPGRFQYKITGTILDGRARCVPEERLLIIGLLRSDMEAIPAAPHEGLTKLSPRLRSLLTERVDKRARAWIVGHVSDWERTPATWWLNRQPEKDRNAFKKVHAFASWLILEEPVLVRGEFESDDADGAKALAAYFETFRVEDQPLFKVPAPMDGWVSIQGRIKAKAVQDALQIAK